MKQVREVQVEIADVDKVRFDFGSRWVELEPDGWTVEYVGDKIVAFQIMDCDGKSTARIVIHRSETT